MRISRPGPVLLIHAADKVGIGKACVTSHILIQSREPIDEDVACSFHYVDSSIRRDKLENEAASVAAANVSSPTLAILSIYLSASPSLLHGVAVPHYCRGYGSFNTV